MKDRYRADTSAHSSTDNFLFREDRASLSDTESLLEAGLIDSTGILELVAFLEQQVRHPRWPTPRSFRTTSTRSRPSSPTSRASRRAAASIDGADAQDERMEYGDMRVEQFLRDSAGRFPGKIALVAGGRRLTYGELDAASDQLAGALVGARRHARRPRHRLHGQLLGGGRRHFRRAQGRRRVQPDQPVDQGRQARLRHQQLPRVGDADAAEAHARSRPRRSPRRRRSISPWWRAGEPAIRGGVRFEDMLGGDGAAAGAAASTSISRCWSTPRARPASPRA